MEMSVNMEKLLWGLLHQPVTVSNKHEEDKEDLFYSSFSQFTRLITCATEGRWTSQSWHVVNTVNSLLSGPNKV